LCGGSGKGFFCILRKKISHGTIPVPDIIEFDGPRGFDDIGFDKFIEALAKDELWNHKNLYP
jgi:hypothetical protein